MMLDGHARECSWCGLRFDHCDLPDISYIGNDAFCIECALPYLVDHLDDLSDALRHMHSMELARCL